MQNDIYSGRRKFVLSYDKLFTSVEDICSLRKSRFRLYEKSIVKMFELRCVLLLRTKFPICRMGALLALLVLVYLVLEGICRSCSRNLSNHFPLDF